MKRILLSIILIVTMTSSITFAQEKVDDWTWLWGKNPGIYNSFRTLGITKDFNNNSYTYFWYADSITMGDTSFRHYGGYAGNQDFNLAIVKHNSRGQQVNVLDIYTPPHESIYLVDIETDKESNLYVYGSFRDTLYVSNNILTTNDPGKNLFLVKLTSDLHYLWGKTITGCVQDDIAGLAMSKDDFIYLSSKHYGSSYDSTLCIVNYFDQDTAIVGNGLNSILKIDIDGNIIWRKELRQVNSGNSYIKNTIFGNDNNTYIIGRSTYSISIDGDTLNHPDFPYYHGNDYQFIAVFNSQGICINSFFIDSRRIHILESEIEIDKNSNYYISGIIWESTIWGNDTIEITEDNSGAILSKLDSTFNPTWSHYLTDRDQIIPWYYINLIDNQLAFSTSAKGEFNFGNTSFNITDHYQVLLGLIDENGEYISHQITETEGGSNVFFTEIDNCDNYIIIGYFGDTAFFGLDTLTTATHDIYFAKNFRGRPTILNMPSDTIGCSEVNLVAPEGYLYYKWNGIITEQNWWLFTDSGLVELEVANEDGCWSQCEVDINIIPEIIFDLGADTLLLFTDTLKIELDDSFESYLWSTGDTTPTLNIPANLLDLGNNQIWLELKNGPCYSSDTLNVFVIDNSSISETDKQSIFLYPNPAMNRLYLINRNNAIIGNVIIYNLSGREIKRTKPVNTSIDIRELKSGIYIIEIVTEKRIIRQKFIKK